MSVLIRRLVEVIIQECGSLLRYVTVRLVLCFSGWLLDELIELS